MSMMLIKTLYRLLSIFLSTSLSCFLALSSPLYSDVSGEGQPNKLLPRKLTLIILSLHVWNTRDPVHRIRAWEGP